MGNCKRCGGTGIVTVDVKTEEGWDNKALPCPDCKPAPPLNKKE